MPRTVLRAGEREVNRAECGSNPWGAEFAGAAMTAMGQRVSAV